jgi:hypothetical protein
MIDIGVDEGTIGSIPVSKNVQILDPGPQAKVSPEGLGFGDQRTDVDAATKQLTLSNTGSQPLVVSAVNVSGEGFSLPDGAGACVRSLAPQDSCNLNVAFKPPSAGEKKGVVEFVHNASDSPTKVGVVGTGVAPAPQHFVPSPAFQSIPPSRTLPAKALPDFRPYVATSKCPPKKRSYPVRKKSGKKVRVVIERKSFKICDEEDVYSHLQKNGLENVRVVPQFGNLSNVKEVPGLGLSADQLQRIIEHGDVVEHSPEAGTELTPPNMWLFHAGPKDVPVLFVNVFRQRQKTLKCGSPELVEELMTPAMRDWPGRTTGNGNQRVFGASDLLRELKCSYQVSYEKDKNATSIELKKVRGKKPMRLTVRVPRTLELSAVPVEGAYDEAKALDRLVSLVPPDPKGGKVGPPVMPVTPKGAGGLVIEVKQTNTSPSIPIAGATVRIDDPDGFPVATSQKLKTDSNGEVPVTAAFREEGTYTIHAQIEGENGLTLDGEGKLIADEMGKRITTASGRIFQLKDGKWVLQKPLSASRLSSAAAGPLEWCGTKFPAGHWRSKDAFLDFYAGMFAANLVYAKTEMGRADYVGTDPELVTAAMINTYLAAQKAGFLERKRMREFLEEEKLEVSHIGPGRISDVDVCQIYNFWLDYATTGYSDDPVTIEDLPRVGPGFDINKGAVPVVESEGDWVLPDGKVVRKLGGGAASFIIRFPDLPEGSLQLSVYDRGLAVIGLLQKEGVPVTTEQIDAIFGVFASGGGNVISQDGASVIASGRGNLTVSQLMAIFRVIASGGGNVISQNGQTFTDAQKRAVEKIISEAGGAIISEAGGAIKTADQLKGLLAVIASGGGNLIGEAGTNLIGEAGTNLTPGQRDAVNQVIASGGGNLIGEAGTNFQLQAFQGVIASGGGNINQSIVDGLAAVIASGGGNLLGEAGTNLTAIVSSFLIEGGQVIASGGGNIISHDGSSLINPSNANFFNADALKAFGQEMVEKGNFVATNSGSFVPTSGGNLIGQAGTNLIGQAGTNRRK